ncbi:MAG TPA: hypothetical protein VJZ00_19590 [Thermoanaerobaculia bacterium]|nr:hypothetical protein [Thermoanaerobaculia bacterium]
MNPATLRRFFSLALVLVSFAGLSAEPAGKRRAVAHPGPAGDKVTIDLLKGTVIDDVTGAPIPSMRLTIGTKSDVTGPNGTFQAKDVFGYGSIIVEATRSGYVTKTEHLTTSGNQTITLRMTPTPTVRVRKTDNSTVDVDFESLEFGYAVPFSGYTQAPFEEFCKNGASVKIDRSEIRRITGPATVVEGGATCCPGKSVLRVNVELKSGEKTDVFFLDSCEAGITRIDLIARHHTQGGLQYIPFQEISEVVFP